MLRVVVDGTTAIALANTGDSDWWDFETVAFHGVAAGLSTGQHTAAIEYKTLSGTFELRHTVAIEEQLRLTAQRVPAAQLVTTVHWPTADTVGTSTSWTSLPLATSVSFAVGSSESVLLLADIARAQVHLPPSPAISHLLPTFSHLLTPSPTSRAHSITL